MVSSPPTPLPPQIQTFEFWKGDENAFNPKQGTPINWTETNAWEDAAKKVRESLGEALNARNVAFLFGSGCSSLLSDDQNQLGIPTMFELAREFVSNAGQSGSKEFFNKGEIELLSNALGISLTQEPFCKNLEKLMEVLQAYRATLQHSSNEKHREALQKVETLIGKVKNFIFKKCTEGWFSTGDTQVLTLYEAFYRKLIYRDRSLPRPWIFTTNYDLFNEQAMDRLGLPYCNGFNGVVERRFNPSTYRYALAEQLDISSKKWTAVDGFVYLCKLHGSISWIDDGEGLFPVREVPITEAKVSPNPLMIYPTPSKQNTSFGMPYADLFREFQARVVREQSVLFALGYSFNDEHINNIIYQGLTVPNFRLIIFATPGASGEIQKLKNLGDPRIWIIGGDGPDSKQKAHYFQTFVTHLMPEPPGDQIETAVKRVLKQMLGRSLKNGSEAPNDL